MGRTWERAGAKQWITDDEKVFIDCLATGLFSQFKKNRLGCLLGYKKSLSLRIRWDSKIDIDEVQAYLDDAIRKEVE